MDGLIECLKECNLKLDALRTDDYRFVAWIIFSTQHGLFVAGVDTYSNDEQNLQYVVAKGIDASPISNESGLQENLRMGNSRGGSGFV